MPCKAKQKMRVISVTGGKGGIGKSTLSVNLATAFAKKNRKVLLFDADLGLANVDVMLGLNAKKNIYDFLSGACPLEEICLTGPHGLRIIPAASGIQKMTELSCIERAALIQAFSTLADDIDIMIIDLASGITKQVIDFTHASQDILLVVCNEPASLRDSYAVIKILHQQYHRTRFGIIANKVMNSQEGYAIFSKFQSVISQFINVNVNYIGHVPNDDYVKIAAREYVTVVDKYPSSNAAIAINHVINGILNWNDDEMTVSGGIHYFFERLVQNHHSVEEQW